MPNDGGVWVKIEDAGSSAPGAAVINDAASNYDNKDAGLTIDGKTYDIYTFTDDARDDLSLTVDTPGFADVLVVAGGGGGSGNANGSAHGGSGAGGPLYKGSLFFSQGELAVTVGDGGAGGPAGVNQLNRRGECGGSSIIQNVINIRGNNDPGTQTPLQNDTFTGTPAEYGMSSVNYQTNTNPGGGGGGKMSNVINTPGDKGTKGIVIVRVEI
jgi:hypothetical protein